jgi:hypothetical protein
MKKLFALLAIGALLLTGCNKKPAEVAKLKVGTASFTTMEAKDFNNETEANGSIQTNTYFATVVLDKDDKIVYVNIDTAQNMGTFDDEGAIVKAEPIGTKKELKEAYGMKALSSQIGIGKEWYEQMDALEKHMLGMTAAEVKAIPTEKKDDDHLAVPTGEDLKTSVTISIDGYQKVVEMAAKNAVEVEGLVKIGLGSVTSMEGKPFNTETEANGSVQVNDTYASVGLDKDGKVVYVYIDTAQNTGTFDDEGAIVKAEAIGTKKELKEAYGMKALSSQIGIGKEWYEQMDALEKHMLGMTVAEVKAIPTEKKDDDHLAVPSGEDLKTSVTISIEGYTGAFEKAANNAVALP